MSKLQQQKARIVTMQNTDSIPSFLLKTYEILEKDNYNDIICWTKNGEGFIVKKIKEFSENVLPIYFRHSNYTSFVRQLNMYDFHKTRQENHQNAFKNMMFKRGHKHLLKDIQRKDYKKNKDQTRDIQKFIERPRENSKNDNKFDVDKDTDNTVFSKLMEINQTIEKKIIALAEIRKLPTTQMGLLSLLDLMFECKNLQKEMLFSFENTRKYAKVSQELIIKKQNKRDFGSTESKITSLDHVKQSLPTCPTLFPTLQNVI